MAAKPFHCHQTQRPSGRRQIPICGTASDREDAFLASGRGDTRFGMRPDVAQVGRNVCCAKFQVCDLVKRECGPCSSKKESARNVECNYAPPRQLPIAAPVEARNDSGERKECPLRLPSQSVLNDMGYIKLP